MSSTLSDEFDNHENLSADENENGNEEVVSPSQERKKTEYDWKKTDTLVPKVHEYLQANSGCLEDNLKQSCNILECFEAFFSHDLMKKIVEETNSFYKFSNNQKEISEKSRVKQWKDTTVEELYCFLAVSLLMPLIKKRRINDYWSTDIYLSTPIFSKIMSRDRYLILLRMLHFADNDNVDKSDKLFKVRYVLDHIKSSYKRVMQPYQNLCIDESLMLYKGRLGFKQYIPSKRHRFGIKFFMLCDCKTGYIIDFIIYTGANTEINTSVVDIGKSGNIVLTLLEPYLDKGHSLFVDNWYTSPKLFSELHNRKTNACGTVRKNRKLMPAMKEKLKKGEVVHYNTEKLLAVKWMDKREVHMLTTLHPNEMAGTGKTDKQGNDIIKPICITTYNSNMGAVDKTDMLQSTTESLRKSIQWYKKVFFHFLDMSVLNSCVIYKINSGNNIPLLQYTLTLVKEIVAKYQIETPRASTSGTQENNNLPFRLTERHFISMYPTNEKSRKPHPKRCIVCSKRGIRKETRYMCKNCDVPLCVLPCFEKYHTKKTF